MTLFKFMNNLYASWN